MTKSIGNFCHYVHKNIEIVTKSIGDFCHYVHKNIEIMTKSQGYRHPEQRLFLAADRHIIAKQLISLCPVIFKEYQAKEFKTEDNAHSTGRP